MRTKEEGTAGSCLESRQCGSLLLPVLVAWPCQEHLRVKSHQFGAGVSVLWALERSRGGPEEGDLTSTLLRLRAVRLFLGRTWTRELPSVLKDGMFRMFYELLIYIAKRWHQLGHSGDKRRLLCSCISSRCRLCSCVLLLRHASRSTNTEPLLLPGSLPRSPLAGAAGRARL